MLAGCGKTDEAKTDNNSGVKYVAYYFHPTARCEACLNLEAFTKELLETKFSKDGFVYKSLNIEEKENEHYRKDFELLFSSVIIENSGSKKWMNLDSVWSYTDDKDKFFKYAEREINNFINTK